MVENAGDHPDLDWLGLERVGEGRWRFVLTAPLSRLDNKLYGGTGLAVSTALLELETDRRALWCTAQFVASADTGAVLDASVEVLAHGRRTSQVRLTITEGERILVAGLGSTGIGDPDGLVAPFGSMPEVAGPDEATGHAPRGPFPFPFAVGGGRPGWLAITEMRQAERADGGVALWARMEDRPLTRAALAFLADFVPMGVVRAAGRMGGGSSLDNAIRFGADPVGDWVLVDLDPHFADRGYGAGAARLWTPDGLLLGVASQTANIRLFD